VTVARTHCRTGSTSREARLHERTMHHATTGCESVKLGTLRLDGGTQAVRVEPTRLVQVGAIDVGGFLHGDIDRSAAGIEMSLQGAQFTQPVLNPGKVICVGLNYRNHIREMGRPLPEFPTLFTKFAETLTGPYDPIEVPASSTSLDWEAELCVVIGKDARRVAPEDALDAVFGYTVLNDVSMRDWQNRTSQWTQGRMFEGTTPVGPFVVSADELPPGAEGLTITCEVDGRTVQQDSTSDLVFSVADLVSYISGIVTLRPGDLIAAGTPGGVAAGAASPRFLDVGSTVVTTISSIGSLENVFVAQSES